MWNLKFEGNKKKVGFTTENLLFSMHAFPKNGSKEKSTKTNSETVNNQDLCLFFLDCISLFFISRREMRPLYIGDGYDLVLNIRHYFKIPEDYPLAAAAPLLRAGITVYSPILETNRSSQREGKYILSNIYSAFLL